MRKNFYEWIKIVMLLGIVSILLVTCKASDVTPPTIPMMISLPTPILAKPQTVSPTSTTETNNLIVSPTATIPMSMPEKVSLEPVMETAVSLRQPTVTQPILTATIPPPETIPPTAVPLVINTFEIIELEDLATGKRIRFRWDATGDGGACIVSGTARRLGHFWQVPLNGTLTVELNGTNFRDPDFTLQVYSGYEYCHIPGPPVESEQMVIASIPVAWACTNDYFFVPAPRRCPLEPAATSQAVEQSFEHGRMIWLDGDANMGITASVYVFFNDGFYQRYEDTWTAAEPEIDPTIIPSEGLHQPIRGLGKVWRDQTGMRERLGWALAPEQSFETMRQAENHEGSSSGAPVYLRTVDGRVLQYGMHTTGQWRFVSP